MPTVERMWWVRKLSEIRKKEEDAAKAAMQKAQSKSRTPRVR